MSIIRQLFFVIHNELATTSTKVTFSSSSTM